MRCSRLARLAFFVGIAVSFGISVYPGDPHIPLLEYSDKLDHAFIFFVSAVLLKLGWGIRTLYVVGLLLFYGALIEGVQFFIPIHHTADWRDFAADIAGMVPGLFVGNILLKWCR